MKKTLITGALALACHAVLAAPLTPTSYSMPNGSGQAHGGSFNYWDLGYSGTGATNVDHALLSGGLGDLTDGITTTQNWFQSENANGTGPYVGWRTVPGGLGADPTVTFFFAGAKDIDEIRVHADDSDAGGVSLPSVVTIRWAGDERTLPVTDPSAGLEPSWLVFGGLGITGASEVSLTFSREFPFEWVFVDEVTFSGNDGTVPVPATAGLVGLGLLALRRMRAARR